MSELNKYQKINYFLIINDAKIKEENEMKQIKMLIVLICATFLVATVQADNQLMDAKPLGKATIIVTDYQAHTVVKLDSHGNILWATDVGGVYVFQAVENPTDKTIYAVGGDKFTKLSSDGAILLQKPISGSTIDVDPSDGSFYVGDYDDWVSISKYDANGNFIKSFGGTIGGPVPVLYLADGSIYTNSYSAGVYKFDKDGNLLWQKQPVHWHNSYGFATIVVDQRDGSVVATAQDCCNVPDGNVGVVVRFDTDGNTLWARELGDLSYSRNAIDPTENVIYGASSSFQNAINRLLKINLTNGDVIWSKSRGEGLRTPSVDPFDGSIYVASFDTKEIVKVDKNGNILWGPKNIGYYSWYLETTSDVVVTLTIDVKPGSFLNPINLKSKGNVPVAILSSPTFDATTVDRNTVVFAGASPLPIGKSPEDVNGDGLLDVVLHFKTQDLNLQPGDTEACLSGKTLDGQDIEGCDSVRIIK
ncbi:MAG: PQQ-binding-like beta-propeller repeat protein [Candidatus Brocadiaceae bacterium]